MWVPDILPRSLPLVVFIRFLVCAQVASIIHHPPIFCLVAPFRCTPSTPYTSYVNRTSHYSRNLASAGWAILNPLHTLILSNGVCIGTATNNQAEYDAVRGLLADSLSHRMLHLHVHLDSLLLVMQLNGVYRLHNTILFRRYL